MLVSPQFTVPLLRHSRLGHTAPADPPAAQLSVRETEVARLVAHGRSNADIAEELHISAGTVKTHVSNIVTKLEVRNRVGIAARAWECGIAHPSDYA